MKGRETRKAAATWGLAFGLLSSCALLASAAGTKTGAGGVVITDDLTTGSAGSVGLSGGIFRVTGSLGQTATQGAAAAGVIALPGYFSAMVSSPAAPSFLFVGVSSLAYVFNDPGNPQGTTYALEISTDNFLTLNQTVSASSSPILATGLSPSTTYYARSRAFFMQGDVSPYSATLAAATMAVPPGVALGVSTFTTVGVTSVTVNWSSGTLVSGFNGLAAQYVAQISTDSSLLTGVLSSTTFNLSASFAGLRPNTTYFAQVVALSLNGPPSVPLLLGSTQTLAATPTGSVLAAVGTTFAQVIWSSGTAGAFNPPGTQYVLSASTSSSFGGALISSATANLFASVASLTPNTTYFLRVRAFNGAGAPSAFDVVLATATLAVPPVPLGFAGVSASSFAVAWSSGTPGGGFNPAGTLYTALVSTSPAFNGSADLSSATANLNAVFPGLVPNTSYYAEVLATNAGGTPTGFVSLGSTLTFAAPPLSGVLTVVASTFISAGWVTNGNPAGTVYTVDLSTNAFALLAQSSQTTSASVSFFGLTPNTTYQLRVSALDQAGRASAFASLGSTITLAAVPGSAASAFAGVAATGLTLNWSSGTAGSGFNPAGTAYKAILSTASDFSGILVSSTTLNLSAAFSGLTPNTSYFAQVGAFNAAGTPAGPLGLGSTVTPAALPLSLTLSNVSASGLSASWGANGNPAGTAYVAEISTNGFSTLLQSSQTLNTAVSFAGLSPNTTYQVHVEAVDLLSRATGFTSSVSTTTPSVTPGLPVGVPAIAGVGTSSFTVNWASGTGALFNAAGTAYLVQISTNAGFSPALASSQTLNLFASFGGLNPNTTYFAEVQSLGTPPSAFLNLGSTATLAAMPVSLGFAGVATSSFSFAWSSGTLAVGFNPPGTAYTALLSTTPAFNGAADVSTTTAGLSAAFGGLTPNTSYFAEVQAINAGGTPTAFAPFGSTVTFAAIPVSGALNSVTSSFISASWGVDGNPAGTAYAVDLSTNNFASLAQSNQTTSASSSFSGLTPNTTYQLRVSAIDRAGRATAFASLGSTVTLAAVPGVAASSFTGVSPSALTLNWSSGTAGSGFNPPGTAYTARLSTSSSFNGAADVSSATINQSASFPGLTPNTSYFAQVAAANAAGTPTAALNLGSTVTPAALPLGLTLLSVSASGLSASWGANGNPAGTAYVAEISTNGFSTLLQSSQTLNTAVSFAGLSPNTTYQVHVEAVDLLSRATGFTSSVSTTTPSVTPGLPVGVPAIAGVGTSSFTVNWASGTGALFNAAGTAYLVQISTNAGFSPALASSQTLNLFASFGGLNPNTTYFAEVQSLGTPPSAFLNLGSTATLAAMPVSLGFAGVATSSFSFAWSSGTLAVGFNPPGTAYTALLSTTSAFNGAADVSTTTAGLSAAFGGLTPNTSYFAEVLAVNAGGTSTAFASLGSTVTFAAVPTSGTLTLVTSTLIGASWGTNGNPVGTAYAVDLSTNNFATVAQSNPATSGSTSFASLAPNTTYQLRVSAVDRVGRATAFASLGSTITLAAVPGVAVSSFTGASPSALTLNWSSGTAGSGFNPAGTVYTARLSTSSSFNGAADVSSATVNQSASFSGLTPNTSYFAQVAAANGAGTPTAAFNLGSTVTPAALPFGLTLLNVTAGGVGAAWGTNGNPGGTAYIAEISSDNFSTVLQSSQTLNTSASFTSLSPNTTYQVQVEAVDRLSRASGFTSAVSTTTPSVTPALPVGGPAIAGVGTNGFTVSWASGTGTLFNALGTAYLIQISTNAGFSPTLASSQTLNLFATFAGLSPNVTYFAEVQSLGIPPSAFLNLGSTATLAAAPVPAGLSGVTTTSLALNWSSGTTGIGFNPAGTAYTARLSTASDFSGVLVSSTTLNLSAAFSGLTPNTSYFAEVDAINAGGTPTVFALAGSTLTFAAIPTGGALITVTSALIASSWGANGNPAGTLYVVQASTDSFATVAQSAQTSAVSIALAALAPNQAYQLRVAAVDQANRASAFAALGSTVTLALTPAAAAASFSGVTPTTLALNWSSGTTGTGFNPAGTAYTAVVSTASDFSGVLLTSTTLNLGASFAALTPNTSYFAQVVALNAAGTPTAPLGLGSTVTPAALPVGLALSNVVANGLSASWGAAGNPAGTLFTAQISSDGFASLLSSQTLNASAFFAGLIPNTAFQVRVQAVDQLGRATAFTSPVSTTTLSVSPALPVGLAAVGGVGTNGFTVNWASGTGTLFNAPGTVYLVQVSTNAGFSPVLASSQTLNLSASFAGLNPSTTYFAEVRSLGTPPSAFLNLGSTATLAAAPVPGGFAGVTTSGASLNWSSGTAGAGFNPAGTAYLVQLSTASDFSGVILASATLNLGAAFAGLTPNTSYFAQVEALNAAGTPTGFVAAGSTLTFAAAPTAAALTNIGVSSITANWGLAANPPGTLYAADLSSTSFASVFASSQTLSAAATFAGLTPNTAYQLRVSALDQAGRATSFASLGSTITLAAVPGSPLGVSTFTQVALSSLTVSWSSGAAAGGFNPAGTLYELRLSTSASFTAASSSFTFNVSASSSGLTVGTTYFAEVLAFNTAGTPTAPLNLGSFFLPPVAQALVAQPANGAFVTALTSVAGTADGQTVDLGLTIRRVADGFYWNFNTGAFQGAAVSTGPIIPLGGTWSYAGSLPPAINGEALSIVSQGRNAGGIVDPVGNTATVTFDTAPPVAAALFPAPGLYGVRFTSITGTVSDSTLTANAGVSGPANVLVQLSYVQGGTTFYFDGSSTFVSTLTALNSFFQATSFLPAGSSSGTWTYAPAGLAAAWVNGQSYAIGVKAMDSAVPSGNVGGPFTASGVILDLIAPSSPTIPVAYQNGSSDTLVVQWQSPGNDGLSGALPAGSRFLVQFSTSDPNVVAWSAANAQVVVPVGSPLAPGTTVSTVLSGLPDLKTVYIRIFAQDLAGNVSALSSVVSGFSGPFTFETLDGTPNDAGAFSSLAVDAAGNLHVAYVEQASGALRYIERVGGAWSSSTTVDAGPGVSSHTSIALDAAGVPSIAYFKNGLRYARLNALGGSTWTLQAIDAGAAAGRGNALAIDAGGGARVAYVDEGAGSLKYAVLFAGAWSTQTVDASGTVGPDVSLALDGAMNPAVAYGDTAGAGSLRYASFAGGIWSLQTAAGSIGASPAPSLALDGSGRPTIAYQNGGLSLAAMTGGGWTTTSLDPGAGGSPSLALDGAGAAHVAYFDAAGSALKYGSFAGSFSSQTIDASGLAGAAGLALALDGAGNVHLSFSAKPDANHALRVAHWSPAGFAAPLGPNGRGRVQSPVGLRAASQAGTSVTWQWTNNASGILGYRLYGSTGASGPFFLLADTAAIAGAAASFTETGLLTGTTHFRYVVATNAAGIAASTGAAVFVAGTPQRLWTGQGSTPLASAASNWMLGLAPQGGENVVFGGSGSDNAALALANSRGATWDLASVTPATMTFAASFSTTVTLGANLTLTNDMQLSGGTLSARSFQINMGGDWSQAGGFFNGGTSAVNFAGSVPQRITGGGVTSFNDVNLGNPTGVTAIGEDFVARLVAVSLGQLTFDTAVTGHTLTLGAIVSGGTLEVHNSALTVSGPQPAGGIQVQSGGTLRVRDSGRIFASSITVNPGATLQMTAVSGTPTLGQIPSSRLALDVFGTIDLSTGVVSGLPQGGMRLEPNVSLVNFSSVSFQNLFAGATAVALIGDLPASATFYGLSFDATVGVNVGAPALLGSFLYLVNAAGPPAGSFADYDPNHRLIWSPDPLPSNLTPTNVQFTNVQSGLVAASWQLYSLGAVPLIVLDTSAAFAAPLSSGTGAAGQQTVLFNSGILPNTTYFLEVKVSTASDAFYSAPISTITLAALPGAPAVSNVAFTSFTVSWSASGNPAGTLFETQLTRDGFVTISSDVLTTASSWSFTGLTAGTTSAARVRAFNAAGTPTAFTASVTTSTIETVPPAAVTTLSASSGTAPGVLTVAWTSVGGDGLLGALNAGSAFRLFLSTDPVLPPAAAPSSAQVVISTAGVNPGDAQTAVLGGLVASATYFVVLWTVDEHGNVSSLSNVATGQAAAYPKSQIAGAVTQSDGTGITGVLVQAFDIAGNFAWSGYTLADGSGTYVASGLLPGAYKLTASWTVNDITSAVSKDGIATGTTGNAFTLETNYTLASISGQIQAFVGSPTGSGGRYLAAAPGAGSGRIELYQNGRRIASVPTKADGSFSIGHLLPGSYQVRAYNGLAYSRPVDVRLTDGQDFRVQLDWNLLAPETAYAFPNPARGPVTLRFESRVLPIEAVISIFDIAGQAVREFAGAELTSPTPGVYHADWDLTNSRGEPVASGVYLFLVKVKNPVTGEVARTVKKVAVVR